MCSVRLILAERGLQKSNWVLATCHLSANRSIQQEYASLAWGVWAVYTRLCCPGNLDLWEGTCDETSFGGCVDSLLRRP